MNKPILKHVTLSSKHPTWKGAICIYFKIYRGKFLGKDSGIRMEINDGIWRTNDFNEYQYAELELTNLLEKHD